MSGSEAPGYIASTSADAYDQALDRILQQAVVGITGLDPTLVRPRWQINTPTMPEPEVNWAAVGVSLVNPDENAYHRHAPAGDGSISSTVIERDELFDVLASFYGPQAMTNAMTWYDGLLVDQNRDALKANGIDLVRVANTTRVPALLAMKWQMRIDVAVTMSRRTVRAYPIRTIATANGQLDNERYLTSIVIKP